MSNASIGNRYASALFDHVGVDGADGARAELDALAAQVNGAELAPFLANPRVSLADKHAVVDTVAERVGASSPVVNLARLLLANGRADTFGAVAVAFATLADAAHGRLRVTVTSATALSQADQTRIDDRIAQKLGGENQFEHRVDADLIGGLVIQVGARVYDNSIRHHLNSLRKSLTR